MVNISKVVNYKQADYTGIKKNAQDAVRYMRNEDPRAFETYRSFIRKGSEAPGYADSVIHASIYDNSMLNSNMAANGDISLKEGFRKSNLPAMKIKEFRHQIPEKEISAYNNNFKLLYPQSWKKRLAISACLKEPTGVFHSVKTNKLIKKIFCKIAG